MAYLEEWAALTPECANQSINAPTWARRWPEDGDVIPAATRPQDEVVDGGATGPREVGTGSEGHCGVGETEGSGGSRQEGVGWRQLEVH